ncbi:MAG: twin-arginine translocase TatA/TatE family subunit [Bradymonadaceae bacterium]|nr:twin-arginine translocase TatA/TatE family subunit [Lujinxingiaceae bacterium]
MMLNLPELILILLITLLVFGVNKLPAIGKAVAHLRLKYTQGLADNYIDSPISQPANSTKPGTRPQPVEDAEYEAPSAEKKD